MSESNNIQLFEGRMHMKVLHIFKTYKIAKKEALISISVNQSYKQYMALLQNKECLCEIWLIWK